MWQQKLTNLSLEQFHTKINGKKLVILYPQITYRNYFLAYFLADTSRQLYYYRIRSEEKTVVDALKSLLEEWNEFGKNTRENINKANATELANNFVKDLAALKSPSIIYLDEIDHLLCSDDYRDFFTTLVKNLPANCQLIINARVLTTEPWQQLILETETVVLGTELRPNDLMLTKEAADKPQLEIHGFGRGHAIVNGLEIEQWDGALPRNLFFYFVDKPLVTRDEIFEIFWPNLNIKEATNVYHVTKRKITEKISQNILGGGDFELTNYFGGFYHPSDAIARYYDVAQFESAVEEASMTFDDDKQAALYRQAVDLYKAPFLITVNMPWVLERREKLQRLFLEALIGLARIYKAANRHEEALGYFARALRENPYREDLHREMMQLYTKLNYPQEALNQYNILVKLLQDNLGVAPAPETKALYTQIKG